MKQVMSSHFRSELRTVYRFRYLDSERGKVKQIPSVTVKFCREYSAPRINYYSLINAVSSRLIVFNCHCVRRCCRLQLNILIGRVVYKAHHCCSISNIWYKPALSLQSVRVSAPASHLRLGADRPRPAAHNILQ